MDNNHTGDRVTDKREKKDFTIDKIVLDEFGLSAVELGLYVAVLSFANDKIGEAFPSQASLAQRAGMSERNVPRVLERLEQKRLIAVIRNGTRGNHYLVLDPHKVWAARHPDRESGIPDTESGTPDSESESWPVRVPTESPEGDQAFLTLCQ